MKKTIVICGLIFVSILTFAADNPPQLQRDYPGGRDEEDLKVREELPQPTLTVDRRGIEEQVLKKMFRTESKPPDKPEEKTTGR